MAVYYAHSGNDYGRWDMLNDHLRQVAAAAKSFAGDTILANEAEFCGLFHDIGKYGDHFQARLKGLVSGLDHWSIGAWLAIKDNHALASMLAIQGHHVGLQQMIPEIYPVDPKKLIENHPQHLKLSEPNIAVLLDRFSQDGLSRLQVKKEIVRTSGYIEKDISAMLDVRMLYSCLVDADFLDTEAHFKGDANGKRYRPLSPLLAPDKALTALDTYLADNVRRASKADPRVRNVRETLWRSVLDSVTQPPGLYTLTAPTGSGKTLAMLRWALAHASANKLRRIIMVAPYLSILEQTASVWRAVCSGFSEHYVLEHHSLAGLGRSRGLEDFDSEQDRQRRLLSENWDAPIVLTSNVQLLESLFANRPSACRKLHNLMEAVIIFDEAQSLPNTLCVPTLAALSHLSNTYRSSIVFATATQPAFDTLDTAVTRSCWSGWHPLEIVGNNPDMFASLKLRDVVWPMPGEITPWEQLAQTLRHEERWLCVVNLKRHALNLLELLHDAEALFHLSTNMCPTHRKEVLDAVRDRLNKKEPCRLISTQCIEAGVDIDFPLVYRAMGPLEAIAQAAGRCNRDGKMAAGRFVVFDPEATGRRQGYPSPAYFQAAEVTRTMLAVSGELDINDPAVFRQYYERLYGVNNLGARKDALAVAIQARDFVEVAKCYRVIDKECIQLLAPWKKYKDDIEDLRGEAFDRGINTTWMRRAQRFSVGIFRPPLDHPANAVLIQAKLRRGGSSNEWLLVEDPDWQYYDGLLGLRLPQQDQILIA
ncbi:MAG: CRISPR-associated endonuclease Cas3'' [Solidesulfovibrio sp.]